MQRMGYRRASGGAWRVLILLAGAGLAIAACSATSDGQSGSADNATPMGHTYISTAVEGGAIPGGGPMTLTFADDRISANSGCNTGTAPVDLTDGVLRVKHLASTLMACPGDRTQSDAWQQEFLSSNPRWALSGEELTLTGETITVRLTDKKVLTPDVSLTSTTWMVTSLITEQAVERSARLDELAPTLTFNPDGSMVGFTGCNQLTGRAEVNDTPEGETQITFTAASTKKLCDPEAMEIERTILATLDGTATASVDATILTLRNPNGSGLTLRAT